MREERFRFIYLCRNRIDIKQISLTWKQFYRYFCGLFLFIIIIIGSLLGSFTKLYHNYKIDSLKNDREHLQKELLSLKTQVSTLNTQLSKIERSGDELRNVASLPPIDKDTRQLGVGGRMYYSSLEFGYYPDEISKTANEIQLDLDRLERAVRLESGSLAEITLKLRDREDRINHFPSIRPILGGTITSQFGYRIDPFTKKNEFHKGVDIPMPKGTKVLATADGIVKEAKLLFKAHKDYGMEIVIDHGYGFETRYAHLSKINVKRGQRVKRWQPIGEVGDTGRATGCHLHYEVMCNDKRQDPENFVYN